MKTFHSLLLVSLLSPIALAADILSSSGFANCDPNADIRVNHANITFDRSSGTVYFDVSGTSTKVQNVSASLTVTAYGNQVYNNSFDPCAQNIKQLCPVPAGTFGANGSQVIPASYLSQIPSIAFTIPDLDGQATLTLTGPDNQSLGCIEAGVTNGKTVAVPAIPYVAVGIAAAALVLSGFAALGSVGLAGAPAPAVSFSTVIGWFQSMQMNGMHSVNYPPIYRSFSQNFAFSGGLVPWDAMQNTIDSFRASTGGNLTQDNVGFLRNSTLVFDDGSDTSSTSFSFVRRSFADLLTRDITTNTGNSGSNSSPSNVDNFVHGIGGYVEKLTIPQANTFMTVLLIFAIILAAITVAILLFKVILEAWALFGTFPKRLTTFRKRYWLTLAKAITQLILILYGIWVLYCIFQFRNGDSWAAKVLAGVTLGTFTGILAFFTVKILIAVRKSKKTEGNASALYTDKDTWVKYSLFYDAYRQSYWWLFMPAIVYMFAKGCMLAAGDGHGLTQTAGLLIIEGLMLILLLWTRPFATKSSQFINIFVQVVRVASVACILVFVEELGIAQSTKTITGVVLIAVQAGLTGLLAILIAINALIMCFRESPHRRKRKEAEKLNRDTENLTPLDPRNSLLDASAIAAANEKSQAQATTYPLPAPYKPNAAGYMPVPNAATESSDALLAKVGPDPFSPRKHPQGSAFRSSVAPSISREPRYPLPGFSGPVGSASPALASPGRQRNEGYGIAAPVPRRDPARYAQGFMAPSASQNPPRPQWEPGLQGGQGGWGYRF